ncbi:MAG: carboxylating nicotinate-nucleotide diphosphorylase [Verrucomicrobiota bacterium]|nr:carboxylating nicotinate-nucleotide diphosphorylase [Verrucomicrobiota bacterium]
MQLSQQEIDRAVEEALREDVGTGDATTLSVIPRETQAVAEMCAREEMILCGMDFLVTTFQQVDTALDVTLLHRDGEALESGACLARIKGPAGSILTAERTSLNFVQHLSGIASITRRFVDRVAGTRARILDTRKTRPGWRRFEKYAVTCGGAANHRIGLFDQVMIKDNHLATLGNNHTETIPAAIRKSRSMFPHLRVEVEADTLEQAEVAMAAGADIVLLDNLPPETMQRAVEVNQGRCMLEASGGINLETVRQIAETGVDFISVGALTHSAPAADISLDFQLPNIQ